MLFGGLNQYHVVEELIDGGGRCYDQNLRFFVNEMEDL